MNFATLKNAAMKLFRAAAFFIINIAIIKLIASIVVGVLSAIGLSTIASPMLALVLVAGYLSLTIPKAAWLASAVLTKWLSSLFDVNIPQAEPAST